MLQQAATTARVRVRVGTGIAVLAATVWMLISATAAHATFAYFSCESCASISTSENFDTNGIAKDETYPAILVKLWRHNKDGSYTDLQNCGSDSENIRCCRNNEEEFYGHVQALSYLVGENPRNERLFSHYDNYKYCE